jgi:hypothetical protein
MTHYPTATKLLAIQLHEEGGNLLFPPEGFLVSGKKGMVIDGEIERAAEWCNQAIKVENGR